MKIILKYHKAHDVPAETFLEQLIKVILVLKLS